MKLRVVSFLGALALVLSIAAGSAAANWELLFTFQKDLDPWVSATDSLGTDARLERITERTCTSCTISNSFANLKFSPATTVASAWMVIPINVSEQGESIVRINYQMKDTANCASCKALVYVGAQPPKKGEEFGVAQVDDRVPPISSFRNYRYATPYLVGDGPIYVAVGFSIPVNSLDPSSGKLLTRTRPITYSSGFDNVRVRVLPAP